MQDVISRDPIRLETECLSFKLVEENMKLFFSSKQRQGSGDKVLENSTKTYTKI